MCYITVKTILQYINIDSMNYSTYDIYFTIDIPFLNMIVIIILHVYN